MSANKFKQKRFVWRQPYTRHDHCHQSKILRPFFLLPGMSDLLASNVYIIKNKRYSYDNVSKLSDMTG